MKTLLIIPIVVNLILNCSSSRKDNLIDHKITNHHIFIRLEPDENMSEIQDQLIFEAPEPMSNITFLLNQKANIQQIDLSGKPVEYTVNNEFDLLKYSEVVDSNTIEKFRFAAEIDISLTESKYTGEVTIIYSLTASDSVDKTAFSREYAAYEVKGYIGEKGVFLSSNYFWYPVLPNSHPRFDITSSSPDNLYIVTQGNLVHESNLDGIRTMNWNIDYPTDAVNLVGSNFEIKTLKHDNIDILTCFFPETQELSQSYLSACQRYLVMYENLIGPYPFQKFAVVENFFPTGYGMPSYTLLGSQVIRLPFIIYTSLGHEVAHNWWGNSVYVDYQSGNWCEGLTTYFADYHYKEMKSPKDALQYRRDLNRDYSVYVNKDNEFSLSEFKERTESSSRAIGYGKSSMVFHQLRKIIGDSLFYKSFKKFYNNNKFKEASWLDIQKEVEKTCQNDFKWFFDQWIKRKGAPKIKLVNAQKENGKVIFSLAQTEPVYRLYVPVKIITDQDEGKTYYVWFEHKEQTFQLPYQQTLKKIAIDPEFDVFRKLDRNEIPPTLSEIFAKENAIIVLPDSCNQERQNLYQQFAHMLSNDDDEITIKNIVDVTPAELDINSFYLLGTPAENSLWEKMEITDRDQIQLTEKHILLNNQKHPQPDELITAVFRSSNNPDQNICTVIVGINNQIGRVGILLKHYGKYSYLVFNRGRNQDKGTYAVEKSPLVHSFE